MRWAPQACRTGVMRGYQSRLLRVFVLDDHDIVRRGLLDLLTRSDITVVGDAGSATQAAARIIELQPDVMVLDVQLQDGSGVQVCRDVRSADPSIRALLLTSTGDQEALILSVLAGAAGAVGKLDGTSDIVEAVRRLGAGRELLYHADAERIRDRLRARVSDLDPPLTPEEAETFALVLAGETDQQIATSRRQPLDLVRGEVSRLIARLTTDVAEGGRLGRHRRDS